MVAISTLVRLPHGTLGDIFLPVHAQLSVRASVIEFAVSTCVDCHTGSLSDSCPNSCAPGKVVGRKHVLHYWFANSRKPAALGAGRPFRCDTPVSARKLNKQRPGESTRAEELQAADHRIDRDRLHFLVRQLAC